MKLQLDNEIYKWLFSLNILSPSPKFKVLSNGKYELDDQTSQLFENGLKFAELIKCLFPVIMDETNPLPLKTLQSLKDQNTPASRLYNWNILYEILKKMGVNLDPEIKSLLVKGDLPMLNEFLKDVYENISNRLEKMSSASSAKSNISTRNYEFKLTSQAPGLVKIPKKPFNFNPNPESDLMNIEQISKTLPLSDCKSLLEILLVSLTRNLDLKPKQAVALLSNGNKYLAHVLVKGVKGNYDPLVLWLQELYTNITHILPFLTSEDLLIPVILQAIKPALLSKSTEITSWGCRIISQLCYELANLELLAPAWEWFTKENGGLNACILCIRRNVYMREGVASVMTQIARFNIVELLTVEVRKFIENTEELIDFLHNILSPLVESSLVKEGILKEGVLDCWIDLIFKTLDNNQESKVNGLNFLVDLWINFASHIEETENLATNFLTVVKKGTRDKALNIRVMSVILLFKLLEFLAKTKNPYAPILYKTLTFSFIENHSEVTLREFYCRNFQCIMQAFPSIPVDILADPLIKQIQVSENSSYFLNIFDLDLLFTISQHPKLQVKIGILLLDLMAKIYLNSLVWHSLCLRIISNLLDRFIETPAFQEYLRKMFDVLLETFRVSERKRKFPLRNPMIFSAESEVEIQNAQQRALIIELIKEMLNRQSLSFNDYAKNPLIKLFHSIKQTRKIEHQGIKVLLQILGNPETEPPKELLPKEIGVQIDIPIMNNENNITNSNQILEGKDGSMAILEKIDQRNSIMDKSEELFMEQEQLLFMEKNKIGFREKKGTENKKNLKSKGNMRVIEDLERLRVKKLEEALKKQIEEEEKKIKEEINKKTLKKKLEKLGVFKTDKPAIVEETKEKALEIPEKQEFLDVFIIDWDLEEDRDRELNTLALKKGGRILRHLFKKFSNTTNQAKKQEFFAELKEKFETISNQDVWRMVKELGLEAICNKEKVFLLMKMVNIKIMKRKETKNLDFEGFTKFFSQFAANFWEKGGLERLFIDIERNSKDMKNFYEEAEDLETIELNKKLRDKPEMEIPENFKKIYEKSLDYRFELPFELQKQLNESYLISYDIVNNMILDAIDIKLIEPQTQYSMLTKAKRKIRDLSVLNKKEDNMQKSETVIGKGQINALRRMKSKEILEKKGSFHDFHEEKEEKKEEERKNYHDDQSVSEKMDPFRSQSQGITRKRSISGKNRIEEEKKRQKFLEEMKKKEAEIKRQQRLEEVAVNLKEMKERKKEEEEKKALEEKQKVLEKEENDRKEEEKKRKRLEENKRKLKEFKEKQESEKMKLLEMEKLQEERKMEGKKKETEVFLKKQGEILKQNFEDKKRERSLEMKKKQEAESLEKQKEADRKRAIEQTLEKERIKRDKEKQLRQEIKELQRKPEIQSIFSKYQEELNIIYNYYIENTELSLDVPYNKENLQFKGFMTFAVEFQITPQVLNYEKMQLVYRSTTKDKTLKDNVPIGVDFKEFQQCLLRIAIKGSKWFDQIGKINGGSFKKEEEEVKEGEWNINEEIVDKEKVDEYERIQETDGKTVEGMMKYLDFPMEKVKLFNKLRDLKSKHDKVTAPRDKKKAFESKLQEKKRERSNEGSIVLNNNVGSSKVLGKNNENKGKNKEKKEKKEEKKTNKTKKG